uniref:uncharacterized protein SPEM3 n=1 Tax=Jaculus jaculus TaxID=51337 RepID=UPI001E1B3486|nr:uncharacterized protein SPEM3 [Jaculus jaculus]
MGQQAHYGAQTCLGTNPRKCQDLGDSILLILGSFILLNVGINVVTLLWRNLKSSLRIIFHHFFPKDPRSLYSRISSHFHRHPSLLLGHANHLDWMPGTNEEKVSRCCWMPPQCGHPIGPREAPRELWKERMVGSKKDPQVTSTRAQASLFSRPESSSQFPKMNKMDILPHALAQESKTKAPDYNPAHASAHICEQSLTQSQTRASEGTHFQAQDLEHASAEAPALIRPPSEVHSAAHASPPIPAPSLPCAPAQAPPPSQARLSAQALEQAQDQSPAPTIVQIAAFAPAPLPVQSLAPTPARGSAHTPEQTSAHTPAQDPGGSQDWVYNPVPSTCQSYRQMSAPPKINWRHHFPGSDARIGHVVFDARQRHSVMGRDKCEALCPRRLGQEAPSNAGEPPKDSTAKQALELLYLKIQ